VRVLATNSKAGRHEGNEAPDSPFSLRLRFVQLNSRILKPPVSRIMRLVGSTRRGLPPLFSRGSARPEYRRLRTRPL